MKAPPRPRVKICCISSVEEASIAIRYGASALGLVSEMPSGPGVINDARVAEVARRVPPPVMSIVLTSLQDPAAIIDQQRACSAGAIQLCDSLPHGAHARLREAMPGITLVQAVHVTGPSAIDEAAAVAPFVDAILLDSGNPTLPVKELGGTGRTHDWAISRAIRELVSVPVFLAGGLRPSNVVDAIEAVGPFAVDVCSGVRVAGKLDERLVAAFFEAIDAYGRGRSAALLSD